MSNILIIDDDEIVRQYLATLVVRENHVAFEAATCKAGLSQMSNPEIQVIIADIFLPDSPPLKEWLPQLKAAANGRPLILITGEPAPELMAQVEAAGIKTILTKPFELAFIRKMLKEVTGA